jgi:hypothetical protein
VQHRPVLDERIERLVSHLGAPRVAGRDEWRFQGKDGHVCVNTRKGVYVDYRTGAKGSLSALLRQYGESPSDEPSLRRRSPLAEVKERLYGRPATPAPSAISLPPYYQPIRRNTLAYDYLVGRGVTEEQMSLYRLGEGSGEFYDRVIVPSFHADGACDYWVVRRIEGWPKYQNPDVPKSGRLGFLAVARQHGEACVLAEGVFSAMACGPSGVAAFGKYVSDGQLSRIERAGFRHVYVALDGDAQPLARKLADRLLCRGLTVSLVTSLLTADQDPADLGPEHMQEILRAAPVCRSRLELVRWAVRR